MRKPEIGIPMFNGAMPLMFRELEFLAPTKVKAGIVLAYAKASSEFVTWLYIDPPNELEFPYCVAGHYFGGDLEAALQNYLDRK